MKRALLNLLVCSNCRGTLRLSAADGRRLDGIVEDIEQGALRCEGCRGQTPIVRGIPRFTPSDDYVSSFSFEWARFSTTQLDSVRGWRQSEERFQQSVDFPLEELKGKLVLDAGCGMGRFAEVAAKYGATVVGVDLSYAVDVAANNLSRWPSVHLLQADLRRLPFRPETFDLIYSLGVLHHTPNPRATFEGLLPLCKPGGKITITVYSAYNKIYVTSTRLWRRLTTKLPSRWVYYLSHLAIPLYPCYQLPGVGWLAKGLWPISLHSDPEWRLLDTFDCYTPAYQSYHTHWEVFQWFRGAGLSDIAVLEPAISFIGTRPVESRAWSDGSRLPAIQLAETRP